jgi:hypothetical protein
MLSRSDPDNGLRRQLASNAEFFGLCRQKSRADRQEQAFCAVNHKCKRVEFKMLKSGAAISSGGF